ncbi:MAG: hypothetical protein M3264_09815 [Thermoproteota archaeon]|nr:hypothetical protein [Thermoproteota archaeon]
MMQKIASKYLQAASKQHLPSLFFCRNAAHGTKIISWDRERKDKTGFTSILSL